MSPHGFASATAQQWPIGSVSRERLFSATVEAAEQRAREARKAADVAACEVRNLRMKGYSGPAQPSPLLGDALNAGYRYLEVKCDGCGTHSAVDLTIISSARRRRFGNSNSARVASRARSNAATYKRGHLVRLRRSTLTTKDDGGPWYPGDQRDASLG